MIFGVGTDIVKIARIESAVANAKERFPEKILGAQERTVYLQRAEKSARRGLVYLASRFAAKEAFFKAAGLGLRAPMSWHGAQILNDAQGKPIFVFDEIVSAWMEQRGLRAQVSLSDEDEYAIAYVILEQAHVSSN